VAAAVSLAPAAVACGVCVEDKVAAAYDHNVVMRAAERGRVVVFAQMLGPGSADDRARSAEKAAGRVPGVDRSSVRVSRAPASLSFALDPRVRTPEQALAAIEKAAAGASLRLVMLRVMR
jgi:hypothetical protein